MCTHSASLYYSADDDRVVVRSYYTGAADEIEDFIRCKRAGRLEVNLPSDLLRFPCVTFITYLDVSGIRARNIQDIGNAIRAMVVLKDITLSYASMLYKNDPITDAIASHPSIERVAIFDMYANTTHAIIGRNRRITSYVLGGYVNVNHDDGDALVSLTGLTRFHSGNGKILFRDGLFVEFIRRNPGIRFLRLVVSRVSEAIEALKYFRSIHTLSVECETRDDVGGLESAIIGVVARCHPASLEIYDGEKWVNQSMVWSNHYVIYRADLPGWNYEWSGSVCDAYVHMSNY